MNIAFFANPVGKHDCKWINSISKLHKCIILTHNSIDLSQTHQDKEIQVYPILPPYFSVLNLLNRNKVKKEISKILTKHKIDICHSMYAYPYAFWPSQIKFPKHIITTRGSDILIDLDQTFSNGSNWYEKFQFSLLKNQFLKALNSASLITSTSTKQFNVLDKYIKDSSKCSVIYTGIDFSKIQTFLDKSTNGSKKNYIFSPRFLAPIYNIDFIVAAFSNIVDQFPNLDLILINRNENPSYTQKIIQLIETKNLKDRVIIKDFCSLQETIQLYKFASATVMVPRSDGTPNSALEAMYCECPVIMSNIGYDQTLFNQNTVWMLKNNTVEELTESFKFVLNTSNNSTIKAKIKSAKETVLKEADLTQAIKKIDLLYTQLMT